MSKETTAFGLSPDKLAQLLSIGSDSGQDKNEMNQEQKKTELLHDRLAEPLPFGRTTIEKLTKIPISFGDSIGAVAGDSIGELLKNQQTELSTLRKIKDFSKKLSKRANTTAEHDTANTMYYAAIASALVFHKKRITKFSYKDLEHSFSVFNKAMWIPSNLKELFRKAHQYCQSKIGS